jgi:ubiquinone/menaquinone biosynthesis C-methylase UbiE
MEEEIKVDTDFELYGKKRFNETARNFENDADVGLWSEHGFKQRFIAFFNTFKEISINKRLKILDIGCGTGAYDRRLTNMGHAVIGVDYSEYVVHKAVEKSKDIQYLISAVPYLPFKDGYFDIVVCIGVLQYVENEWAVISEIARILKKSKGILMLITLNSISIRESLKKMLNFFLRRKEYEGEMNERRYNPFKLKRMLKNFGYLDIAYIPHFKFIKIVFHEFPTAMNLPNKVCYTNLHSYS